MRQTFEQRRKALMSNSPDWGDLPPFPSQSPPSPAQPPVDSELGTAFMTREQGNATSTRQTHRQPFISTRGWTIDGLLARSKSFYEVPRVSASVDVLSAIHGHDQAGVPMIIEGLHESHAWSEKLTLDGFQKHSKCPDISARNVHNRSDKILPLSTLVEKLREMPQFTHPDETERLYGKDAECPPEWEEWLHNSGIIPSSLLPKGSNNLLNEDNVQTLMCYLGIGDTFTPCHKDLCASSGQNLMCYTEASGSSFWFMTESSSAPAVTDYFHKLKQEIDSETHVITLEELEKAPFKVYIAEQKLGDMVLVPPRSCHQVLNHGGITIKTSWSRMTLGGLKAALYHELPIYRRVCRSEIYRVKYTIHRTLLRFTEELETFYPSLPEQTASSRSSQEPQFIHSHLPVSSIRDEPLKASPADDARMVKLENDITELLGLMDDILTEVYSPEHESMAHLFGDHETNDDHITCDFCDGDIFQSFFECQDCVPSDNKGECVVGGGLAICPGCYVDGRTCRCGLMRPIQCRPFEHLIEDRNRAATVLRNFDSQKRNPKLDSSYVQRHILSKGRFGIFRAACQLQNSRSQNFLKIRTCNRKTKDDTDGASHSVPLASTLRCKKCHAHKCFDHILQIYGIHSVEALLQHWGDDEDSNWHKRHCVPRSKFEVSKQKVLQAEMEGSRPELCCQLARVAETFSTCKPKNSTNTKLGWYDKRLQLSIVDHGLERCELPTSLTPSTPLSPLTDIVTLTSHSRLASPSPGDEGEVAAIVNDPTSCNEPDASNDDTVRSVSNSLPLNALQLSMDRSTSSSFVSNQRSRKFMDFVLVPPADYLQRDRSQSSVTRASSDDARSRGIHEEAELLPAGIDIPSAKDIYSACTVKRDRQSLRSSRSGYGSTSSSKRSISRTGSRESTHGHSESLVAEGNQRPFKRARVTDGLSATPKKSNSKGHSTSVRPIIPPDTLGEAMLRTGPGQAGRHVEASRRRDLLCKESSTNSQGGLSDALNKSFRGNGASGTKRGLEIFGAPDEHTRRRPRTSDIAASDAPPAVSTPSSSSQINLNATHSASPSTPRKRALVTSGMLVKMERKMQEMSDEIMKLRDEVQESRSAERTAERGLRQVRVELNNLRESHEIQANKTHDISTKFQQLLQATQGHPTIVSQPPMPVQQIAPNQIVVNSNQAFDNVIRALLVVPEKRGRAVNRTGAYRGRGRGKLPPGGNPHWIDRGHFSQYRNEAGHVLGSRGRGGPPFQHWGQRSGGCYNRSQSGMTDEMSRPARDRQKDPFQSSQAFPQRSQEHSQNVNESDIREPSTSLSMAQGIPSEPEGGRNGPPPRSVGSEHVDQADHYSMEGRVLESPTREEALPAGSNDQQSAQDWELEYARDDDPYEPVKTTPPGVATGFTKQTAAPDDFSNPWRT